MRDDLPRNISNIKVSKECYKRLKIISIDKEITIQEAVQDILEKFISKKNKEELV